MHCDEDFVEVIPWGTWAADPDPEALRTEAAAIRAEYQVEGPIVLALSRISPEKGQDQLLLALRDYPEPLTVFICGDAAFMQGRRHLEHLHRLAARLPRHVQVHFPGHVTGLRKHGFFAVAALYVFPSRHESYGLTLLEALHSGLPAVCLDHQGSRDIVRNEFGRIVKPGTLARTIHDLLSAKPGHLAGMGAAARRFALEHPFSNAAAKIAAILRQGA
jgi:glycosyltransferase involved in cell wall biosynthesis